MIPSFTIATKGASGLSVRIGTRGFGGTLRSTICAPPWMLESAGCGAPSGDVRSQWLTLELRDSRLRLRAYPLVVEPVSDGRTLPKKNELVWVVLNDEGEIHRVWLMNS